MFKTLIGVIIVAVAVIVTFMFIDPNVGVTTTNNGVITSAISSIPEGYNTYMIEGEVSKPGNYVLADGATMGDLIEAAGGVTEYADDLAYYDTATVDSGLTYYIPSKYDTSNVCSLVEIEKVNINSDSAETLLTLNVFTSSVANSVVSYRTEKGEFKTIEDLLNVYGIGNATYRKLRNYVTLHQ